MCGNFKSRQPFAPKSRNALWGVYKSIPASILVFKVKLWHQFGRDGVTGAANSLPLGTSTSPAHPSLSGKEFRVWRRAGERLHERDSGCNPPTVKLIESNLPLRRLVPARNHPDRSLENPVKFAVQPSQIAGGCLKPNRSDARGLACATIPRTTRACRSPPRAPAKESTLPTVPLALTCHSTLSLALQSLIRLCILRTQQHFHHAGPLRIANGFRRFFQGENTRNQRARIDPSRSQQCQRRRKRAATRADDGKFLHYHWPRLDRRRAVKCGLEHKRAARGGDLLRHRQTRR